jgi:hypothetical protein
LFPLPGTFNVEDHNSWASLAKTIHDWLVAHEDHLRATSKFVWGVQAFWIAYTAAFPSFPNGLWPVWNPAIDINGEFIQDRFRRFAESSDTSRDLHEAWMEFQHMISRLDDN